ncbi:transporter, major facilitator family protein [Brevibacterium mcbrellneri ATCC 49030]|uniref:Transporter, major facilitator family protein n=1 Tax=Brevibacterium mcbrellneri ATCC 49030 TaxID=585530 RepID=D4YMC0_9MICO|nr:MFS transporter [Brevibacterium mcbrellneri]EFG47581.1 transporter, major facilitator family protein [Brevibacterium mcbrellneri ATCC 49030]
MYKQLFWPVYAPSLLFHTGLGATLPVYVLGALSVGATPAFASLIVAIMGIIQLTFAVPAGMLIDRIGDRATMLIATSLITAVSGVTVFSLIAGPGVLGASVAVALYAASLFLRAPSEAVWTLARQSFITRNVPTHFIGRAMTALGGTIRVGNLVGPLAGAVLVMVFPLWSVFVFATVCAAVAVALLYSPVGSSEGRDSAEVSHTRAAIETDASTEASAPKEEDATEVADTSGGASPRLRGVNWTAVILAGLPVMVLMGLRIVQPVIVQLWGHSIGLSEAVVSLLIALGAAIELVIMFPGGYAKDRLGRAPTLIACVSIFGAGFLALVVWPHVTGAFVAVVIMALGNGLGAGINMTIGADLCPAENRGRFLGIWSLFSNTGRVGGPAVVSAFVTFATLGAGIVAIGLAGIAGAVWMAVFAKKIGLPSRVRRTSL